MSSKRKSVFTLDEVFRLATAGGIGSRHVVFIPDEYAVSSRHSDSVILTLNPGSVHAWVRDSDIERARHFASGSALTQGSLASEIAIPETSEAPRDLSPASKRAKLLSSLKRKPRVAPTLGATSAKKTAEKRGASYSNVAVHGFWQVALFNKAVDLTSQLAVAPFDDTSGLFLLLEGGQPVSSGMYRANMAPGSSVPISEASVVDVSERAISSWRCPVDVCITSAERLRASQRQNETRAIRFVAIGALAVVAAVAVYILSAGAAQRRLLEFSTLSAQADEAEARIAELKKATFTAERYPDGPSIVAINAIQQLYYSTQDLRFDWQSIIGSDEFEFRAEASRPFHQLSFAHTQNLKPDGSVTYSWPRRYVAPAPSP